MTTKPVAAPRTLSSEDLKLVLPHRPPMLFIDHVPWIEPARAIAVTRPLGVERNGVPRPADGTVAEEIILEAAAQAVAIVIIDAGQQADPSKAGRAWLGVLAAIPEFRFFGRAPAGAVLTIEVETERQLGRIVTASAEVYSGAERIAEGRMTIGIGLA